MWYKTKLACNHSISGLNLIAEKLAANSTHTRMREGDHSVCGCMNLAAFYCCRLVLDGQIVCHVFWYVAILPENELSYSAKAKLSLRCFFLILRWKW